MTTSSVWGYLAGSGAGAPDSTQRHECRRLGGVVAASVEGKRELAEWLARNDPDTLAAIKELAGAFGKFEAVEYRNNDPAVTERLRNELTERSKSRARAVIGEIKRGLNDGK